MKNLTWIPITFLLFGTIGLSGSGEMPHPKSWFSGAPSEAFALAKSQQKNLFLYWGAEWCPPCNKLKSDVLSHPRFPDLVKDTVNVYMDGESEGIQFWSDKLKVKGYPTLLFLSSNGTEIMRLKTASNFADFSENFRFAQVQQADPALLVRRLLGMESLVSGNASDLLKVLQNHKKINDLTKNHRVKVRKLLNRLQNQGIHGGSLAEFYLYNLSDGHPAVDLEFSFQYFLDVVLTEKNLYAFRYFITRESGGIAKVFHKKLSESQFVGFGRKWIEAVNKVRRLTKPTPSVRVLASSEYPYLDLHDIDAVSFPLDEIKRENIKTRVLRLEKNLNDVYKRKSAVTVIAYILNRIDRYSLAKQILQKEGQSKNSGWYYFNAIAGFAKGNKNSKDALKFSEKALEKADTPAAKIQMYRSYLQTLLALKPNGYEKSLSKRVVDLYEFLHKTSGSFVGRNARTPKWVADNLGGWELTDTSLKSLRAVSGSLCEKQKDSSFEQCQNHRDIIIKKI